MNSSEQSAALDRGASEEGPSGAQEVMASAGTAPAAAGPEKAPPSRWQRLGRRLLRWLVAVLLIYALGVLSAYWVRIRPQQAQLLQAQEELQTAEMTIQRLEEELVEMNQLKADNTALQAELEASRILQELLSALVEVSTAQVALADGDVARAKAALAGTDARLERLQGWLDEPEALSVESMRARLDLALQGLEDNTFAAQKDLEVLASDLATLRQKRSGD